MLKSVLLSLGVLVVVVAVVAAEKYHDKDGATSISKGVRKMAHGKTTDILLYHDSIKVDGSTLSVQENDVCFPPKDTKHAQFTITAFTVQGVDKKPGLVFVHKNTGVDKHKICLRLKSKRGQGYHFDIDVYGTYN